MYVNDYRLTMPSCLDFLRFYSIVSQPDYNTHTLGKYIIEVMLMEDTFYRFLPSQLAAAAVYVARSMTHQEIVWPDALSSFSGYGFVAFLNFFIIMIILENWRYTPWP